MDVTNPPSSNHLLIRLRLKRTKPASMHSPTRKLPEIFCRSFIMPASASAQLLVRAHSDRAETATRRPCADAGAGGGYGRRVAACCSGRMIFIERFERGSTPRYQPSPPAPVIRIDTSRSCPSDRHPSMPVIFVVAAQMRRTWLGGRSNTWRAV